MRSRSIAALCSSSRSCALAIPAASWSPSRLSTVTPSASSSSGSARAAMTAPTSAVGGGERHDEPVRRRRLERVRDEPARGLVEDERVAARDRELPGRRFEPDLVARAAGGLARRCLETRQQRPLGGVGQVEHADLQVHRRAHGVERPLGDLVQRARRGERARHAADRLEPGGDARRQSPGEARGPRIRRRVCHAATLPAVAQAAPARRCGPSCRAPRGRDAPTRRRRTGRAPASGGGTGAARAGSTSIWSSSIAPPPRSPPTRLGFSRSVCVRRADRAPSTSAREPGGEALDLRVDARGDLGVRHVVAVRHVPVDVERVLARRRARRVMQRLLADDQRRDAPGPPRATRRPRRPPARAARRPRARLRRCAARRPPTAPGRTARSRP